MVHTWEIRAVFSSSLQPVAAASVIHSIYRVD